MSKLRVVSWAQRIWTNRSKTQAAPAIRIWITLVARGVLQTCETSSGSIQRIRQFTLWMSSDTLSRSPSHFMSHVTRRWLRLPDNKRVGRDLQKQLPCQAEVHHMFAELVMSLQTPTRLPMELSWKSYYLRASAPIAKWVLQETPTTIHTSSFRNSKVRVLPPCSSGIVSKSPRRSSLTTGWSSRETAATPSRSEALLRWPQSSRGPHRARLTGPSREW